MKQKAFTDEHSTFLRTTFPTTFGSMAEFSVGDGWFGLLRKLGETCEASMEGVRFLHMKEKYASLVCYSKELFWIDHWENRPAENEGAQLGLPLNPYRISTQALREAIDKSVETCECCGKPGRGISSQYHWESVSCRDCREPTDTPNDPEGDALDTFTRYHACVERICALVGESAPEDTYEGLAKLEAILDQGLLGPKAK